MSVPQNHPTQYGDILLFAEGGREREAVGDMRKREDETCMRGATLGYKNSHQSRAVGTAGLPHHPALSPLNA